MRKAIGDLAPRHFCPEGGVTIRDKASDAYVVVYDMAGIPCAIAYHGKAQRPDFWLRFKTIERREAKVREHFQWRQRHAARKVEARVEKAEKRAKGHKLQVGHVLRASWGYDQTNIDYYQVVELVGRCSVRVRELCSINVEDTGWLTGKSMPGIDQFKGEPTLHRVSTYDGASVRIDDVRSAYLWEGRPDSWTAYH